MNMQIAATGTIRALGSPALAFGVNAATFGLSALAVLVIRGGEAFRPGQPQQRPDGLLRGVADAAHTAPGRPGPAGDGSPAYRGERMPHIILNSPEPGIRGLLRYRPETGRPLSELAEVLLRGPSTLTRGERELIAAYVSALNECQFCSSSHSACAAAQLPGGMALVEQVRADASNAPVSAKLKTLLAIAAAVRQSGLSVSAAAFCMFNRYVDGLATIAPEDPAVYAAGAQRLIKQGYLPPPAEPGQRADRGAGLRVHAGR
jgi:hypothetical protein